MRYHALATDYDGTLAHDGRVAPSTVAALERLAATGRRLILVTGREFVDLERAFDRLDLFDRVVVENGGVLFDPATKEERPLTAPADERLVARLREAGVSPLSVGRTIVATWEPNQNTVLDAIRDLGLELEVIFNKGAVMVLPTGVTKASGLNAAALDLGLSLHNVVGVGDAQNDHAFMISCELAAAVANALDSLKDDADLVLERDHGAGVEELVDRLVGDDLASLDTHLTRQRVGFGAAEEPFAGPMSPNEKVLIAGSSGAGKSTLVTAFAERLGERGYQYCLVDPEGDYEHLEGAIQLGTATRPPTVDEVLIALEEPARSVTVDLLALAIAERPAFFDEMLGRLVALRVRSGRPHWIIADEAHHLLPEGWQPKDGGLEGLVGMLLVTVHPERVAESIVRGLDVVVGLGEGAPKILEAVATVIEQPAPGLAGNPPDEALLWRPNAPRDRQQLTAFQPGEPRGERQRHRRKYAEGRLGPDKSFYFRGPADRLNLRAQNLELFVQIAEGVDDETWLHHLRGGDYSRWIRNSVKDDDLATAVATIEEDRSLDGATSRRRVREAVESRYAVEA